jgi:hypothetical protein
MPDTPGDRVAQPTNEYSPLHPHEPETAPVYDHEGRCLVCGCEWRDQEIALRDSMIEELRHHLRGYDPGCSLLPENTEENDSWEREAHGFPRAEDAS